MERRENKELVVKEDRDDPNEYGVQCSYNISVLRHHTPINMHLILNIDLFGQVIIIMTGNSCRIDLPPNSRS